MTVAVVAANGEEERGPLINFALRPDTPAMARDNSSDDRQPNTGAGELCSMQALEGSEQLVGISHVEADAIVADEVDSHAVADFCADRDDGPVPRPGIFDGIAEQIFAHTCWSMVASPSAGGSSPISKSTRRPAVAGSRSLIVSRTAACISTSAAFNSMRPTRENARNIVDHSCHALRAAAHDADDALSFFSVSSFSP